MRYYRHEKRQGSSYIHPKPEPKVELIYKALNLAPAPFVRKKSVVLKIDPRENGKAKIRDEGCNVG